MRSLRDEVARVVVHDAGAGIEIRDVGPALALAVDPDVSSRASENDPTEGLGGKDATDVEPEEELPISTVEGLVDFEWHTIRITAWSLRDAPHVAGVRHRTSGTDEVTPSGPAEVPRIEGATDVHRGDELNLLWARSRGRRPSHREDTEQCAGEGQAQPSIS